MPSRRKPNTAGSRPANILYKSAADGFATLVFVLGLAASNELSRLLAPSLRLSPGSAGLALVVALLIAMGPLCARLGGALFNPANNAMMYATGKGDLKEHAVRGVGQCLGAISGVLLAQALLPYPWQKGFSNMAVGLRPDVDVFEGAACEFVLGLLLAFTISYSGELKSRFWKLWLPLIATVLAVRAGAPYSGPSLNPAVTFGFEFLYQQQTRGEHFAVFWAAPVAAGLMGGWCYLGMREFTNLKQQRHSKQE